MTPILIHLPEHIIAELRRDSLANQTTLTHTIETLIRQYYISRKDLPNAEQTVTIPLVDNSTFLEKCAKNDLKIVRIA